MKRFFSVLCVLLACCFCVPAACAKTVLPAPSDISVDDVACKALRATIDGFDAEARTVTLSIYDIESFTPDQLRSLEPGDVVVATEKWTQEKVQFTVGTVDFIEHDTFCIINQDAADRDSILELRIDNYGEVYQPARYSIPIWARIGTRDFRLAEGFLFLDGIDTKAAGDSQDIPDVYTAEQFFALLAAKPDRHHYPFHIYNIYAIFNESGELATVYRFFVSWQ